MLFILLMAGGNTLKQFNFKCVIIGLMLAVITVAIFFDFFGDGNPSSVQVLPGQKGHSSGNVLESARQPAQLESGVISNWNPMLPLGSTRERIEALSILRATAPDLFSEPVIFDRDIVEVLGQQAALTKELAGSSSYRRLATGHGPRLEIEIDSEKTKTQTNLVLDATTLNQWRDRLVGAIEGLRPLESDGSIAADKQLSEEIIRILTLDLSGKMIGSGRDSVSSRRMEARLASLIQIHLLLQNSDGRVEGSLESLTTRLKNLDESALSTVVRSEEWNRQIDTFSQELWRRNGALVKPFRRAVTSIEKQNREFIKDTVSLTSEKQVSLILREVPPILGIFRGYVGGDRSTQLSFSYANSPSERVFFITDKNNLLKGYVAGTVVRTSSGTAFYVHTMNGAKLTATEAESILTSLYHSRSDLKVDAVVLPTERQLNANINYAAIRGIFEKLAAKQTTDISYLDFDLRPLLKRFVRGDRFNDDPTRNTQARAIAQERVEGGGLRFTIRPNLHDRIAMTKVTSGDAARLLLTLIESGRGETSTWIEAARVAGLDQNSAYRFRQAVVNSRDEGSADQVMAALRDVLRPFKVEVDQDLIRENWALFGTTLWQASDSFTGRFARFTRSLTQLALYDESSKTVEALLDSQGTIVMRDAKWSKWFANSDILVGPLASRLHLLDQAKLDASTRTKFFSRLEQLQPGLKDFYQSLKRTKTAADFARRVTETSRTQPLILRDGVRSSLEHFFAMKPTPEQILALARAIGDRDEFIHLRSEAMEHARSAKEFVELASLEFAEPIGGDQERANARMIEKLDTFLDLNPSIDDVNTVRATLNNEDADLKLVRVMSSRMESAGDYIRLVTFVGFKDHQKASDSYRQALSELLRRQVERFSKLEPTVSEINAYRVLVYDTTTDLMIMELSAPKVGLASDFLKMVSLFGNENFKTERSQNYWSSLQSWMTSHYDMFVALNPSVSELDSYKQKMGKQKPLKAMSPSLASANRDVDVR